MYDDPPEHDPALRVKDIYLSNSLQHDPNQLVSESIHNNFDDVRVTSGQVVSDMNRGMPIVLDQKCLTHQMNGQDM